MTCSQMASHHCFACFTCCRFCCMSVTDWLYTLQGAVSRCSACQYRHPISCKHSSRSALCAPHVRAHPRPTECSRHREVHAAMADQPAGLCLWQCANQPLRADCRHQQHVWPYCSNRQDPVTDALVDEAGMHWTSNSCRSCNRRLHDFLLSHRAI